MMTVKNNKTILFFLVSLCSFLVFSCGTPYIKNTAPKLENLTIKGKVFLEDPFSSSTDRTFDYVEGDGTITIRSGNSKVTTDADGSFELEGLTSENFDEVLFEASKPGYQTAYRVVRIDYVKSLYGPYSLDFPIDFSIVYKPRGYSASFNNNTGDSHNSIYYLDDDDPGEIYIFLLKEATSRDWNVFEYRNEF